MGSWVTKTTIKLDQNIQNITKDMLKVVEEKTAMMGGLQQISTITDAVLILVMKTVQKLKKLLTISLLI